MISEGHKRQHPTEAVSQATEELARLRAELEGVRRRLENVHCYTDRKAREQMRRFLRKRINTLLVLIGELEPRP